MKNSCDERLKPFVKRYRTRNRVFPENELRHDPSLRTRVVVSPLRAAGSTDETRSAAVTRATSYAEDHTGHPAQRPTQANKC